MTSLIQKQGSKTGKRESYLSEQYQMSLERRIAQGCVDLVCGNEDLCVSVEGILRKGDPRDVLTALKLDALATIEDCLRAPPDWSHTVGGFTEPATAPSLGAISKAFEVLERATLNLYLYPWRKEYRVVKMFSGMFTHLVRPALSEQQVEHMFGLLGYQKKGVELELQGTPSSAATLLDLACTFFAARCVSRLLSKTASMSRGGAGVELTLVRLRQKGRSLQGAVESRHEKVFNLKEDPDVDMYTEWNDEGEMGEASTGTEKRFLDPTYRESMGLTLAGSSSASAQSQSLTIESQPSETRSLGPEGMAAVSQAAGDGGMGTVLGQNQACTCLPTSWDSCGYHCQQCNKAHNLSCDIVKICKYNKHNVQFIKNPDLSGPAVGGQRTLLSSDV